MKSPAEIVAWAQRVISRRGGPPHKLLDLREGAGATEAQVAFHKVARMAHPDLYRNALSPEQLELVTSAYAAVAGAYMDLRELASRGATSGRGPAISAGTGRTPPAGIPQPEPEPELDPEDSVDFRAAMASGEAAGQMSPKALTYCRKADAALKRGDLKSAMLQIKLAISSDSTSSFLRKALASLDAELRRTT